MFFGDLCAIAIVSNSNKLCLLEIAFIYDFFCQEKKCMKIQNAGKVFT